MLCPGHKKVTDCWLCLHKMWRQGWDCKMCIKAALNFQCIYARMLDFRVSKTISSTEAVDWLESQFWCVTDISTVCSHVVLKVSPISEIYNMHCQESLSLMYRHWQISKIYSHINVCCNLTISCVSLSCWHDNNTDATFVVWSLQCYRRLAFHPICKSCNLLLIIPLENIFKCDLQSGRN